MASEFVVFQVAAVGSLIGMTLGWRGVMSKYAGFYDTTTAWNQVFWGILLGTFYASANSTFLLKPYIEIVTGNTNAPFNVLNLIILSILASVGVHLLLRRDRVRRGGSQPTSGWALGLSMGGMLALTYLYYLISSPGFTVNLQVIGMFACIAIFTPQAEAIINAFHGSQMLHGRRWGAVLRSALWRAAFLVMLSYSFINPLGWLFVLPFIMIYSRKSADWIWDSIPKESRRRLRRIWADEARRKRQSESPLASNNSNLQSAEE